MTRIIDSVTPYGASYSISNFARVVLLLFDLGVIVSCVLTTVDWLICCVNWSDCFCRKESVKFLCFGGNPVCSVWAMKCCIIRKWLTSCIEIKGCKVGRMKRNAGGDNGLVWVYTVNVLVGKGMLGRCELGILSGTGSGNGGGTTRESWEVGTL